MYHIALLILIFGYSSGFLYGYGGDVLKTYIPYDESFSIMELGYWIASLKLSGVYVGQALISSIFIYSYYDAYYRICSVKYLRILIPFLLLLNLPFVLFETNILRQGLAIAFIILAFKYGGMRHKKTEYVTSIVPVFIHSTGILLVLAYWGAKILTLMDSTTRLIALIVVFACVIYLTDTLVFLLPANNNINYGRLDISSIGLLVSSIMLAGLYYVSIFARYYYINFLLIVFAASIALYFSDVPVVVHERIFYQNIVLFSLAIPMLRAFYSTGVILIGNVTFLVPLFAATLYSLS